MEIVTVPEQKYKTTDDTLFYMHEKAKAELHQQMLDNPGTIVYTTDGSYYQVTNQPPEVREHFLNPMGKVDYCIGIEGDSVESCNAFDMWRMDACKKLALLMK